MNIQPINSIQFTVHENFYEPLYPVNKTIEKIKQIERAIFEIITTDKI